MSMQIIAAIAVLVIGVSELVISRRNNKDDK